MKKWYEILKYINIKRVDNFFRKNVATAMTRSATHLMSQNMNHNKKKNVATLLTRNVKSHTKQRQQMRQ